MLSENENNEMPPEDDWINARKLCTFLEKFYELTLRVYGSLHVTSNSFLHKISNVTCELIDQQESGDLELSNIARKMQEKFDKYWGSWEKTNMLIYIAVLLDPRYKEQYVQFVLELRYGASESLEKMKIVKEAASLLFNDYKLRYESSSEQSSEMAQSSSNISNVSSSSSQSLDVRSRFKRMRAGVGGEETKTELEKFLSEDVEDDLSTFNILDYWKVNSSRFPILHRMVRDVLAVPISTVASESAFSSGGRILDPFRSSLTPRMVQALLCTEDWLRVTMSSSRMSVEEDLDALETHDIGKFFWS